MTLDEQIAWLEQQATVNLSDAREYAKDYWVESADECREHAATLLTIENTLRAMRDAQR